MISLNIELPDDLYALLRRSPKEIAQEVRLAAVIDWYQRGFLSQGRAAEIAGMPRQAFLDALAARRIEVVSVDEGELRRETGLE
jgi:predicted HTH domain antitoxin